MGRIMGKDFETIQKDLTNLLDTLKKIDNSKGLIESKVAKQRYWGARSMISSLSTYNELIEKVKAYLSINVNGLEEKAVDTLVKEGYGEVTDVKLLEKYGYIKKEENNSTTKKLRQNPNTK